MSLSNVSEVICASTCSSKNKFSSATMESVSLTQIMFIVIVQLSKTAVKMITMPAIEKKF